MADASGEVDTAQRVRQTLDRINKFLAEFIEHPLLKSGVIGDVIREYKSAKDKHGEMTLDGKDIDDLKRFTALMEEVGEVAETYSYDAKRPANHLRKELIQVANVALTWASILPEGDDDKQDG